MYQEPNGNQLKVFDILSVFKYAISIGKIIIPDNEEYLKNKIFITTLNINAILNNKLENRPINEMLYWATSFIVSIIRLL